MLHVAADTRSLEWLADESVDLVLAESRALSLCLATEVTAEHLRRVLRPGGRLMLVVESLLLGLARLAEQGRWAELADAPSADVVLVPQDDGTITRCFWPEELQALLTEAGLRGRLGAPAVGAVTGDGRARAGAGRRRRAAHAGDDRARPGRRAAGRVDRAAPAGQRAAGPERGGAASALAWSSTQRAASGRTSRRASGISLPQSTQVPYVPSSRRGSAATTCARCSAEFSSSAFCGRRR